MAHPKNRTQSLTWMLTFKKSERLCTFYHKEKLFSEGKRLFVFPLGFSYLVWSKSDPLFLKQGQSTEAVPVTSNRTAFIYPCKVMISVPKRLFKRASHRNRIRRLVKESFRKNKLSLYAFLEKNQLNCLLSVVYLSPNFLPFGEIDEKMAACLKRLGDAIPTNYVDNNCWWWFIV